MKVAIITGASSGLGKAYFERLKNSKDIESFWVIARRKERLEELKSLTNKEVRIFDLDLSELNSFNVIKEALEKEKPTITYLINAAGFGKIMRIQDASVEELNQMLDVNCRATILVTQLCLPYMEKGSHILEIGSMAGFIPLPNFSIYSATKAFVETYTKALHYELKDRGVLVSVVCPYWIKDTEFIPTAKKNSKGYYQSAPFASVAKDVVNTSLRDNALNLWVSTPGIIAKSARFFSKLVPHQISIRVIDWLNR